MGCLLLPEGANLASTLTFPTVGTVGGQVAAVVSHTGVVSCYCSPRRSLPLANPGVELYASVWVFFPVVSYWSLSLPRSPELVPVLRPPVSVARRLPHTPLPNLTTGLFTPTASSTL